MRSNILLASAIVLLVSATGMSKKKEGESPAKAEGDAKVWVMKSDGAQSCGVKGEEVTAGAEELKKAGVQTYAQSKGNDGKMYGQACGMPTGSVNAYQILQSDLPKAMAAGYKEAPKAFPGGK